MNTFSSFRNVATLRGQSRRSQTAATAMSALERFEELLEHEQRQNSPEWLLLEEEKLTQARLALFGSAPK